MKSSNAQTAQSTVRNDVSLDSRYGEIGISAVAAALQYKGDAKNPVHAPAVAQPEDKWVWSADIAA